MNCLRPTVALAVCESPSVPTSSLILGIIQHSLFGQSNGQICLSPVSSDFEHLDECLLTSWVSSSINYLAHFIYESSYFIKF